MALPEVKLTPAGVVVRLQVNERGAWRNVIDEIDRESIPGVKLAIVHMGRALPAVKWRLVEPDEAGRLGWMVYKHPGPWKRVGSGPA